MSKADGVFIYIGTYASEVDARADYDVVKDLHAVGRRRHLRRRGRSPRTTRARSTSTRTRRRRATAPGVAPAAGALVGILFPPSIIGSALVGAAIGGVSGHLWKGMSRADVKEFGDVIDAGEAALVIVGETTIEDCHREGDAQGAEEGGQGAPGRQEGRRRGGAGGREGDLLIRRDARAGPHTMIVPHVLSLVLGAAGGAGDPGLGAQDRRPAPGGHSPPGAGRLRAGLPAPRAPVAERAADEVAAQRCTRRSRSSASRWSG